MKEKIFIAMAAMAVMCGCEKAILPEDVDTDTVVSDAETKKFTFTVKGDFGSAVFSDGSVDGDSGRRAARAAGYLSADGQDMTDLWVFDFVNGECVQKIHQEKATAGESWGVPSMRLTYGSHHIYFVASRGTDAIVDETAHTITWSKPSDTFWKDYEVSVVSTSNGNRAVTMERVATKLRVAFTDEVPTGCAKVTVTPEKWYYGWDYVSGVAVVQQQTERTVTVPASMAGTTGQLAVNIFGLSGGTEWTTDFDVKVYDDSDNVIGSVTVEDAPFKANRATEYSGAIFGDDDAFGVSLSAEWSESVVKTW